MIQSSFRIIRILVVLFGVRSSSGLDSLLAQVLVAVIPCHTGSRASSTGRSGSDSSARTYNP